MGIVSKTLMTAIEEGNPSFAPDHCLNRRQTRHPCRACAQNCPGQAIPANPVTARIDWTKCINCGLCVTACPARCFALDIRQQKAIAAPAKSGVIGFGCLQSDLQPALQKTECLCGVPWEWLAALAMRMQVRLYVGKCDACARESCRDQLKQNLLLLELFLGEERFARQVILAYTPEQMQDKAEAESEVNRRELLGMFRKNVKKIVAASIGSMMPKPEKDPAEDGFAYRRLLADLAAADCIACSKKSKADGVPAEYPEYGVLLPDINENCYACGLCARICPQQAITVEKTGDGESVISLEPWKCTACGLCAATCLTKGVSGMAPVQVRHLEKQRLVRVHHDCCSVCGIPIAHDAEEGMCIACGVKARSKRRK